ncbi:hypothetical protein Y032_0092g2569 [Ancylostoma ceylanicum]|uniref:ERAP1-like C-terminal domain-containing protein n=1 Tax=Ancylostoma ceylanicum TaxID=53326 RepID=A0A016TLX1_9BILA|nr:hypothetical protein Y032_0092g2569 [Ancylostoma ceylanicum]
MFFGASCPKVRPPKTETSEESTSGGDIPPPTLTTAISGLSTWGREELEEEEVSRELVWERVTGRLMMKAIGEGVASPQRGHWIISNGIDESSSRDGIVLLFEILAKNPIARESSVSLLIENWEKIYTRLENFRQIEKVLDNALSSMRTDAEIQMVGVFSAF